MAVEYKEIVLRRGKKQSSANKNCHIVQVQCDNGTFIDCVSESQMLNQLGQDNWILRSSSITNTNFFIYTKYVFGRNL